MYRSYQGTDSLVPTEMRLLSEAARYGSCEAPFWESRFAWTITPRAWQLVINTGTTVITFLMVFLMQNTQNRDAKAIHLKLDELLRGVKGACTGLVRLEGLTEAELVELEREFEGLKRPRRSTTEKLADHASGPEQAT